MQLVSAVLMTLPQTAVTAVTAVLTATTMDASGNQRPWAVPVTPFQDRPPRLARIF